MELLKDLLLVDVTRKNEGNTIVFTFLNEEVGEIYEVNFNKQVFNKITNKFEHNEEQAEKVEQWCVEHFGVDSNSLGSAVGIVRKDVYKYDTYCSLWESNSYNTNKFEMEDEGLMIQTKCKNVIDDGTAIKILFDYEEKEYESNMRYSKWFDSMKKYIPNPVEKQKKYDKFYEKFGIHIENKEDLIGKDLVIEIRVAAGKHPYAEIKPFVKKKK